MNKEILKRNAVGRFRSGFNCSQSVLSALAVRLDTDVSYLEKVSSGFGGGMGHMQETCGAVTGSYMAISIYCGNTYADNNERKEEAYRMIRQFKSEFERIHKTTICKELIKYELDSPEEHDQAVKENVFEDICEKCICDAVDILDRLLNK